MDGQILSWVKRHSWVDTLMADNGLYVLPEDWVDRYVPDWSTDVNRFRCLLEKLAADVPHMIPLFAKACYVTTYLLDALTYGRYHTGDDSDLASWLVHASDKPGRPHHGKKTVPDLQAKTWWGDNPEWPTFIEGVVGSLPWRRAGEPAHAYCELDRVPEYVAIRCADPFIYRATNESEDRVTEVKVDPGEWIVIWLGTDSDWVHEIHLGWSPG